MNPQLDKWNRRFRERDGWLDPEPWVMDHARSRSPGRLLDLACGDGRHAVALAALGWTVVGVDGSDEGLARLARHASERGVIIETHQVDLDDQPKALEDLGRYDVVLISHFRPSARVWTALRAITSRVWLVTFDERQQARTGFRWGVSTADLQALAGWSVVETTDLDDCKRARRGWVLDGA